MKHKFILSCVLVLILFIYSCSSDRPTETTIVEQSVQDSVISQNSTIQPSTDLEIYRNIEIVDYCVLIPMEEYEEKFDDNEKAAHAFMHKSKKNNTISIQGLLRANTEVKIEEYFAGSLEDAEMEGKIIEKKELITADNCFYSKGYWNNSIYESRFIEVCWLRSDEVVKYYSFFDIADTTIWDNRLKEILSAGSNCK